MMTVASYAPFTHLHSRRRVTIGCWTYCQEFVQGSILGQVAIK